MTEATEPVKDPLEAALQDAVAHDPNVIAAEGAADEPNATTQAGGAGTDAGAASDDDAAEAAPDAEAHAYPGSKTWVVKYGNGAEETVVTDAESAEDQCMRTFGMTLAEAKEHGASVKPARKAK